MQTYTTDHDTARHAPTAPLMLHTAAASRRRDLTAGGSARPVMRELDAAPCEPATASRLARLAVADQRSTEDRVVDRVVDGLMAELGWTGPMPARRRHS
jgi:hypothetical protein